MTTISRGCQLAVMRGRRFLLAKHAKSTGIQPVRNGGSFYQANNFEGYGDSIKQQMKNAPRVAAIWRNVFFVAAIPSILFSMWLAWSDHVEEHKHGRKPYVEYPYLNVRNKPFPWGDGNHTLFHNPERNWVPGVGFEKEPSH